MSNIQLSEEAIERVFKRDGAAGCAKMESVFDHMYQDRTDKSTLELVGEL